MGSFRLPTGHLYLLRPTIRRSHDSHKTDLERLGELKSAAGRLEGTGASNISHFGYQHFQPVTLIGLQAISVKALKFQYPARKWSNLSPHRTGYPVASNALPSFSCFPEFYLLFTPLNKWKWEVHASLTEEFAPR